MRGTRIAAGDRLLGTRWREMDARDFEDLATGGGRGSGLLLAGDQGTRDLGFGWLDGRDLDWLRGAVLHTLARNARAAGPPTAPPAPKARPALVRLA